jgi:membrane-bound lytic murein transglycosylase B
MDRPAEKAKPWFEYQPIFVNERRIREGADFWLAHRAGSSTRRACKQASRRNIWSPSSASKPRTALDRPLPRARCACDAGLRLPGPSQIFRGELEQFLLLTASETIDPLTVKGSYAGAMGAPQFMPSNYRRYAVDADARRPYQSVDQLAGRVRERRQLPQATRLECRRARAERSQRGSDKARRRSTAAN